MRHRCLNPQQAVSSNSSGQQPAAAMDTSLEAHRARALVAITASDDNSTATVGLNRCAAALQDGLRKQVLDHNKQQ